MSVVLIVERAHVVVERHDTIVGPTSSPIPESVTVSAAWGASAEAVAGPG